MSKIILLAVILLFVGTGLYFYKTLQKPPTATQNESPKIVGKATPSPKAEQTMDACQVLTKGSADVPPLYSGIKWSDPKKVEKEILEYDKSGNSSSKTLKGCAVEATAIDLERMSLFDDVYYMTFERDGWNLVSDFGGPEGSLAIHKKENKYLLIENDVSTGTPSSGNLVYDLKIFYSQ